MHTRKKLIEVALPLDAINEASVQEKLSGGGGGSPHPRGLHQWWARRPMCAARAILFAQLVDDPSEYVDELLADRDKERVAKCELKKRLEGFEQRHANLEGSKEIPPAQDIEKPTLEKVIAEIERERLFGIIKKMSLWKDVDFEKSIKNAQEEIQRSWRRTCENNKDHLRAKDIFDPEKLPAFHDPFAGGGTIPLEASRLGLESYAGDLNPVAVLINKAMIEIPPKFANHPPINPVSRSDKNWFDREWKGMDGFAEDIIHYSQWIWNEMEKRIGYHYPKVEINAEVIDERQDLKDYQGRNMPVIAWLWVRTVKSPNPAFADVDVPLASNFMLSTKAGKEAYIEPVIEDNSYRFSVKVGKPIDMESKKLGTKIGRAKFRCLMSGVPIESEYIRGEFKAKRSGVKLMALVVDGNPGRIYLNPTREHEKAAFEAKPKWKPEEEMGRKFSDLRGYGISYWHELFTSRQLMMLTMFSDLIGEVSKNILTDTISMNFINDERSLREGGVGKKAYSEAICIYLSFILNRCVSSSNVCTRWRADGQRIAGAFGKQAIPIVWDFSEVAILNDVIGGIASTAKIIEKSSKAISAGGGGYADQLDAALSERSKDKVISTDPPYYDNIFYAELSDFFYIWLRRLVGPIYPDIFSTLVTPKKEELIANRYIYGDRKEAEAFFLEGMTQVMSRLSDLSHPAFPLTIYYAFKQQESKGENDKASTGWETFLGAVIRAGFSITGTLPIRSEGASRMITLGTNALASSIVLVCRKRPKEAPVTTTREFLARLKAELPPALMHLQRGNIAPVDLAQAMIGPGMAVYTRYEKVINAEGKELSVREALVSINRILDETLAEQEGDFDAESRWALVWFEQSGFGEGDYGDAELLSKAKGTSPQGLVDAEIIRSFGGKVRLLKPSELKRESLADSRMTVWKALHHLVQALQVEGESATADVFNGLGAQVESARELCYRLYSLCERKKRDAEARPYNELVRSWPEIVRLAREKSRLSPDQSSMDLSQPSDTE